MARIGLKHAVAAALTETTTTAYAGGFVIGKAIKADVTINSNNVKLYAEDIVSEYDKSFKDGSITLDVDDLLESVQASLLGHTYATGTAGGESDVPSIVAKKTDSAGYFGVGYYGRVKRSGLTKYRAVWFTKVVFAEPNDTTDTEGETPAFGTRSLVGEVYVDVTNQWKEEDIFTTEAGAVAWLDGKAGIPTSDSAGLSGLTMAGTGGTLSPTFGAAVRYYAFGGLTGTSCTVTATAASHTITLYVNDVLTQTLTSGSASSAIAIAAIGTKKLRIVAQETGKTPQTTEIIVEKVS